MLHGVEERPYQATRRQEAVRRWADGQNCAVVIPTGTGKTIIGMSVIDAVLDHAKARAGRALWIVDSLPLKRQTEKRAAQYRLPVEVRTIQGLKKIPPGEFDILVVDEAHKHLTDRRAGIIQESRIPAFGLTATPRRGDGQHIKELFGDDYVGGPYTIGQAIEDGWLCDCLVKRVVLSELDLRGVKRSGDDFHKGELKAVINTPGVNREIVARFLEHAALPGGGWMIGNLFAIDTEHSTALGEDLDRQVGYPAQFTIHSNVPGGDATRDELLARWLAAERPFASSVMMVAEGFDYPALRLLGLARPTKSERLLVQMLGRGLRPHPTKPFALVLDFDGAYETLDLERIYDVVEAPEQDEPAVTEPGACAQMEDDPIPMLSDVVSRVRVVDLLRRTAAEARTLPWYQIDGFMPVVDDARKVRYERTCYALPVGTMEWVVVASSKHDRTKAAVGVHWFDGHYAKHQTVVHAAEEADAFRQAEHFARTTRILDDRLWQQDPDDVTKNLRRWFRDRMPPSHRMVAKLKARGVMEDAIPRQHGAARMMDRRAYATGAVRQS